MADQPATESTPIPEMSVSDAADRIAETLDDSADFRQDEPVENDVALAVDEEVIDDTDDGAVDEEQDDDEPETDESENDGDNAATDEPDDAPIQTVSELAEALDTSIDEVMDTLKMQVKVNGEVREVSLKEAQAGYQMESDYRKKTTAHSETVKKFEADRAEAISNYQSSAAQAKNIMSVMHNMIAGNLNSPEMQQLRQSNPAEWTAQQSEAQKRIAMIERAAAEMTQTQQGQQQQQSQSEQESTQRFSEGQAELLTTAIADQGKTWGSAEKTAVSEFLSKEMGWTPEKIERVGTNLDLDHSIILLAMRAMETSESASLAEVAKKKLKKIPRRANPGKPKAKSTSRRTQAAKLKARLGKTGKTDDAAAAIEAFL